jgi:hypothetical protein
MKQKKKQTEQKTYLKPIDCKSSITTRTPSAATSATSAETVSDTAPSVMMSWTDDDAIATAGDVGALETAVALVVGAAFATLAAHLALLVNRRSCCSSCCTRSRPRTCASPCTSSRACRDGRRTCGAARACRSHCCTCRFSSTPATIVVPHLSVQRQPVPGLVGSHDVWRHTPSTSERPTSQTRGDVALAARSARRADQCTGQPARRWSAIRRQWARQGARQSARRWWS